MGRREPDRLPPPRAHVRRRPGRRGHERQRVRRGRRLRVVHEPHGGDPFRRRGRHARLLRQGARRRDRAGGLVAHRSGQAQRREPRLPSERARLRQVHAQDGPFGRRRARHRRDVDRLAHVLRARVVGSVRHRRVPEAELPQAEAGPQGHRQQRRDEELRRGRAREDPRRCAAPRRARSHGGLQVAARSHHRPVHVQRQAQRRPERRRLPRGPPRPPRRARHRRLAQSLRLARAELDGHVDVRRPEERRRRSRPRPPLVHRPRRLLRQPVGGGSRSHAVSASRTTSISSTSERTSSPSARPSGPGNAR